MIITLSSCLLPRLLSSSSSTSSSSPRFTPASSSSCYRSRDSSVYSAELLAGWSGVWVPAGAGNFFIHHRVQTGSGAHPASYPMGTRGSFPGVKRPGHEADHSSPYSAEVTNAWGYTSAPQYAFMVWCLVTNKKHRDNFIFYLVAMVRFEA
jgi:hypothetical protein